jgi:hypothetical protein
MIYGTYDWTRHSQYKMRQYGISEGRVQRIIRHPERYEEGVISGAIAVMQPTSISRTRGGVRLWKEEIWVMYMIKKQKISTTPSFIEKKKILVITAWRYPGVSPKRDPVPFEILNEVSGLL